MSRRGVIDWPYVIGLTLLPIALVAVLLLAGTLQGIRRYDPAYFSEEYLRRYDTPAAVLADLEDALHRGDRQLMRALLGTRREAKPLTARPNLEFIFLVGQQGDYLQYLFLDTQDYSRLIQYVRPQGGRYVAAEADFFFYMDSGGWMEVAGPLAASWWILVLLFTAGVYAYRKLALTRQSLWGGAG